MQLKHGKPVESIYQEDRDDKMELIEKIPSTDNQENKIINTIALNKIIENLNTKEKQIILLRFYKDKTQSQIGKMMGISQVQVSRIEKKVLLKMREKLEA